MRKTGIAMAISGWRSRPRRLEWEDDGVSVPWLSSGLAVYLVAMLNTPFWRRIALLIPPTTLENALFHGALFTVLSALYACGLCLAAVRGLGRPLLAVLLLYSSLALYLLDNFGLLVPDMLRGNAGWREFVRLSALWQIGFLGVIPALLITRVPIGRRRGVRELVRRLRFCLLCLLVAACVAAAQHRRLGDFFDLFPDALVLLNPVNAITSGAGQKAAEAERPLVPPEDTLPPGKTPGG